MEKNKEANVINEVKGKNILTCMKASGCGSVARADTFTDRDPLFKSRNQQCLIYKLSFKMKLVKMNNNWLG